MSSITEVSVPDPTGSEISLTHNSLNLGQDKSSPKMGNHQKILFGFDQPSPLSSALPQTIYYNNPVQGDLQL